MAVPLQPTLPLQASSFCVSSVIATLDETQLKPRPANWIPFILLRLVTPVAVRCDRQVFMHDNGNHLI